MAYNNVVSKYVLKNPEKFIKPKDSYMKSYNESTNQVLAKSNLELKAFMYFDNSESTTKWSLEPFAIKYISPKDNKVHRYYPDCFVEMKSTKFLVEIKSSNETEYPKKPKKVTTKSKRNYNKALQTFAINQAKWKAAKEFCDMNKLRFIIVTEKQLGTIKRI